MFKKRTGSAADMRASGKAKPEKETIHDVAAEMINTIRNPPKKVGGRRYIRSKR